MTTSPSRSAALWFVLSLGVASLFADFTYEGARSVLGPYLALLGASGFIVGAVTGFGELVGYGLRLISGRLADQTGKFWPITIFGYVLQMTAVPLLALTMTWQWAAVLIVLERTGKAIRNPPRDVMLSYAGKRDGGYGWAFGIHEALDQCGAMIGPLVVSAILSVRGSYHLAFAVLAAPAVVNLACIIFARIVFPVPSAFDDRREPLSDGDMPLPKIYWLYLAGAALVAAGYADYPLVAYHFSRAGIVDGEWVAVLYAIAMACSGAGSLLSGRLFDRNGFPVLIVLTAITAAFAPLVFLGGFWAALLGAALWGVGMGVHESIIPAAVAPMVPATRRASAFGLFTAGYGVAWFAGSALIGLLYDRSVTAVVVFCVVLQLAAIPVFLGVSRRAA